MQLLCSKVIFTTFICEFYHKRSLFAMSKFIIRRYSQFSITPQTDFLEVKLL
jgi:hypothetical protein